MKEPIPCILPTYTTTHTSSRYSITSGSLETGKHYLTEVPACVYNTVGPLEKNMFHG